MDIYEKIQEIYKENEILKDFSNLHHEEGVHCGKWEDDSAIEESCEDYLTEMIKLADKYDIKYDKNLNSYKEDEDELEYYTKDKMGFELKERVEYKLLTLLNGMMR